MARIASTTSAGVPVDPTGGMTLDALMARQKALAEAQGQIAAPRNIQSPWQGAAQMLQAFVAARQGAYAENQLTAGRDALAKIRAGINLDTGPTSEQISQASMLDPDYADKLTGLAADAVRARRQREQELADRAEGRTYAEGQTAATRKYEAGQEAAIDTRELGQAAAVDQRELAQAQAATSAANTTEQVRHERDLAEALAKEKREATTYGPVITGEAATAVGLDPAKSFQLNQKTGQYDPVGGGGGITIQNVPPEAAGRLGLATNFLDNYDAIQAEVDAGNLTGPVDYLSAVTLGRGSAGTAHRTIQAGSDSLLRNLTGAGMPAAEAAKYVSRYEPTMTDDAPTLHNKLEGLKTDLENVQAAVTLGRKWLPGGGAGAGTPPPAAGGATPPPAPGGLPTPQTPAEFNALAPGSHYIDPDDGKEYVK